MFWRKGRCRWWLGPTGGQGLRWGFAFAPGAGRGVFHEAAAGEGGEPAGFVDGQQMGVFKQDFEVPRESGSFQGGRDSRREKGVWPEVTDSLPVAMSPLRVTSPLFSFCCQACGVEWG